MSFFAEFIRNPTKVTAVKPSNRALAQVATTTAPSADSPVVELGLDTGSFTEAIQRRLTGRGRHIAVAPADEISGRCRRSREIEHANVVASGLPWSAFAVRRQRDGLARVASALPPDGVFTTFAPVHTRWAPPARCLLRSLRSQFEELVASRAVGANLPPALVKVCCRPNERLVHSEQESDDRARARSLC